MPDKIEKINGHLETLALRVVTLEEGDIPGMGQILNTICSLETDCEGMDESVFLSVVQAVKGYLERLILGEAEDTTPLEEGISFLQSIYRSLSRDEEFQQDISFILEKLGSEDILNETDESQTGSRAEHEFAAGDKKLTDEDIQIFREFVTESLENLESIEVKLIHLEESPDDLETINDIFRPFHTIKGISSYLNLDKINSLSHSAESLLDKARDGEIKIDEMIIDIILESVDTLKKMVIEIQEGLEEGVSLYSRIDTTSLVGRIEELNNRSEKVMDKPLGEILVEKGFLHQDVMGDILEEQKRDPGKKIGEILVTKGAAGSKDVISALRDQRKFGRKDIDLQVRVDTKKLDTLVEMTGELVIAHSMLKRNDQILSTKDQSLYKIINQISQITSTLQQTSMSMRMVPIKSTFTKMVRVVRDLAKNSGKKVGLKMQGEDTEIDRNMVDELYEPMVHMIRNAVDHGIEMPDEREKAGKDRRGVIELCAYHRGGNIVIEIKDDGRGLHKKRILEKARSKNLFDGESHLTDSEIFNLVLQPGFSTAKEVTGISGRGVGMDVAKKAVDKLRGRIEITSKPEQGSIFTIRLPLTLAIIEGILCRVGQERYVIPSLAIIESFLPREDQYFTVEGKEEMILSRDEVIPLIRLGRIFGVNGDAMDPWNGLVVTVEHGGEKRCLLLDEILGKEEVVIKSLGESLRETKGIAGGAIMGDGRVGLILDIPGVIEIAKGN
ncbi:MAG: chemotaxis protein CheA [Desulfobacterales bacterium]